MANIYTIKQGDTLGALATNNKTDIATLQKLNPQITDPNKISIGATLNLPDAPVAPAPTVPGATPMNAAGDTMTTLPQLSSTSDQVRNQEQAIKDEQAKKDAAAADELKRLQTQKQLQDLKSTIAPDGTTTPAPTAPVLSNDFKGLLSEKDLSGNSLENYQQNLLDNRKAAADIQSSLNEFNSTAAQGQSESAFLSQKGEKERLAQQSLDRLDREANIINQQVSNRTGVINTIMGLKKEDYANSKAAYDTAFTQNLNLIQTLNSQKNAENTQKTAQSNIDNVAKDNARANLQIIQSHIQDGTIKYDNLDAGTKATIDSLEAQAGFPKGFTQFITSNVKGDVVSTNTRTDNAGNQYFDVLTRGADGSLKVTSIYGGQSRISSTDAITPEEKRIQAFQGDAADYITKMDKGDLSYDAAFQALKTKYPEASDKTIHSILGEQPKKK